MSRYLNEEAVCSAVEQITQDGQLMTILAMIGRKSDDKNLL